MESNLLKTAVSTASIHMNQAQKSLRCASFQTNMPQSLPKRCHSPVEMTTRHDAACGFHIDREVKRISFPLVLNLFGTSSLNDTPKHEEFDILPNSPSPP